MNGTNKSLCLGLLIACCAVPAVSFAGKCAGTNINNTVSWEPSEISKGTTLATFRTTSVTVSDDPSAAYHLVSGECISLRAVNLRMNRTPKQRALAAVRAR